MSVSNLTGTRWLLNETWDNSAFSVYKVFNIGVFLPNTTFQYELCQVQINTNNSLTLIFPDGTRGSWFNFSGANEDMKLWHVWGGTDAINQDLIDWFELNATQQEVESEDYLTNTYDLTQVANAIRNTTKSYVGLSYPSAMVNVLNNMGDFWTIEQLMAASDLGNLYYSGVRTSIPDGVFAYNYITTAEFPNVLSIGYSAFYTCRRLTTISFPKCTYIGNNAFYACSSLTSASFPNCTAIYSNTFGYCSRLSKLNFLSCQTIGQSAFFYCSSLTSILSTDFPNVTQIEGYAFRFCSRLITVSFPQCISIGEFTFANCTSLTTVSLPICTRIGVSAFLQCSQLTDIYIPNLTIINDAAFSSCSALSIINFSLVSTIKDYAFNSCISLSTITLPSLTTISGYYHFRYCYNLISFNLTGVSQVPTLSYSNTFWSTPIAGYSASAGQYGSIYVPASLYDAFTSATNWTYFSSRMVSV